MSKLLNSENEVVKLQLNSIFRFKIDTMKDIIFTSKLGYSKKQIVTFSLGIFLFFSTTFILFENTPMLNMISSFFIGFISFIYAFCNMFLLSPKRIHVTEKHIILNFPIHSRSISKLEITNIFEISKDSIPYKGNINFSKKWNENKKNKVHIYVNNADRAVCIETKSEKYIFSLDNPYSFITRIKEI